MDVADRGNFPVARTGSCHQIFPRIIVRATIPLFQSTTMKTQARSFRARSSPVHGFTLMEVIVAMGVFVMVTLGIYQMLFQSYELVRIVRARDAARVVLESFGNQFFRLQTTMWMDPPTDTVIGNVELFKVRPSNDLGSGLKWQALQGDADGLVITLGQLNSSTLLAGSPIQAKVTEVVSDLNDADGALSTTGAAYTAAGRMLQGKFTITYTLGNRVHTQTLIVARSVQ